MKNESNVMEAKAALSNIQDAGTKHSDEPRMVRAMQVDDWVRQGDLNIVRIESIPEGKKGEKLSDTQLAPGTTKGSRHCAVAPASVFKNGNPRNDLEGPFIVSRQRFTVTHPEHGDVSLPSGTYGVTYQRDFEREEIARVAD